MYNRYIPQPDGSYQRSKMPEPRPAPSPQPIHNDPPSCDPPKADLPPPPPHCRTQSTSRPQPGAFGFIKNLLPKELDTGDLLIILLLLLMAGDSEEGRNNALLTLALYFLL